LPSLRDWVPSLSDRPLRSLTPVYRLGGSGVLCLCVKSVKSVKSGMRALDQATIQLLTDHNAAVADYRQCNQDFILGNPLSSLRNLIFLPGLFSAIACRTDFGRLAFRFQQQVGPQQAACVFSIGFIA
jgi:hypothetical protein